MSEAVEILADRIAFERYSADFYDLPEAMKRAIWREAELDFANNLADKAEYLEEQ